MSVDPFAGFELESRIVERGRQAGLRLSDEASRVIAAHARAVLENNVALKLTTITEPDCSPTRITDRSSAAVRHVTAARGSASFSKRSRLKSDRKPPLLRSVLSMSQTLSTAEADRSSPMDTRMFCWCSWCSFVTLRSNA